jgi:hypothetical protein
MDTKERYRTIKKYVQLNDHLLFIALHSYYSDIYRFTSYSGSQYPNTAKQCAYLMKWLTKIKPIQLIDSNANIQFKGVSRLNSAFAMIILGLFIKTNEDVDVWPFLAKEFNIRNEILYTTFYRDVCPKQLSTLLELLISSAKNYSLEKRGKI